MAPALDHVFVCCSVGAPEASALTRLGLKEGSPNTHPGQGTANRRFFFANAYLELLWVIDAEEARSEAARRTRLWERWSRRGAEACPFGVVLRPGDGDEDGGAPFIAWSYRPRYLPPDVAIEVAAGTSLSEPGLFYLPFARRARREREPIVHALPVQEVTRVTIGIPGEGPRSESSVWAAGTGLISFESAGEYFMSLVFDAEARGNAADLRPELPLLLRW